MVRRSIGNGRIDSSQYFLSLLSVLSVLCDLCGDTYLRHGAGRMPRRSRGAGAAEGLDPEILNHARAELG